MRTSRLEAFSDGVFAIAITLLVLEIGVPEAEHGELAGALGRQWPSYAAYAVSFLVIGIIWINHHAVLDHLERADRGVLYLNLFLLAWIGLIPWPTALLAEYLREGDNANVAAAVYTGAMTGMGFAFAALWTYVTRRRHLLGEHLSDEQIARMTRRFTAGSPVYAINIAIAFVSPVACLVVNALLAIYYASATRGGAIAGPGS
jgi:TMEM175 potassium channel family protein